MATPGQWRYTVNIPLWIMGKDAEGESVVVSAMCLGTFRQLLGWARVVSIMQLRQCSTTSCIVTLKLHAADTDTAATLLTLCALLPT